jgi:hypothetical protein
MKPLSLAILAALATNVSAVVPEPIEFTTTQLFSIDGIQGDFHGTLYADDPTIVCDGVGGDPAGCEISPDGEFLPYETKSGVLMNPIDSEFGFYVSDFVGAADKVRDEEYLEGWVGVGPGGELLISNIETDVFRTLPGMGTWCAGVGGDLIKCSTERYVVMEHALTCNESIRYFVDTLTGDFVNPATGQAWLVDPETGEPLDGTSTGELSSLVLDCSQYALDDNLYYVEDGVITENFLIPETNQLCEYEATDPGNPSDALPCIPANESSVLMDLAVGRAYGMTKKDDGKPLYRMGGAIKRPNDVRLYLGMDLPQEWLDNPGTEYTVTKALLKLRHTISNNPNDQVRPEDYENEAAIGRLPSYSMIGDNRVSLQTCYENDGDFLPVGIKLLNADDAYSPADCGAPDGGECTDGRPYPYSEDLREGITAGFAQTIDREPFEWGYVTLNTGDYLTSPEASDLLGILPDDPAYDFTLGGPLPDDVVAANNLVLKSGPRWRLKPPKFGQDIPGLEIPTSLCEKSPPFASGDIKYATGVETVTVLNLLDWEGGQQNSPLATSSGWTDPENSNENTVPGTCVTDGDPAVTRCVSVNGLPLTSDKFDLAIYVKGDKKPVTLYDATLEITYLGGPPVVGQGDRIGTYRPSDTTFRLDLDGDGVFNDANDLVYGPMGSSTVWPVAGDFNGDGVDTIGYFSGGVWNLDFDGDGVTETVYNFGNANDLPVVGDWNGDGTDEIGTRRPWPSNTQKRFYLDVNGNGAWDLGIDLVSDPFGWPKDLPIAGDWDNDGTDEIGIYRPSTSGQALFALDQNGNLVWDAGIDVVVTAPVNADGYAVVGDWDDNGVDDLGYLTPAGVFHLGTNVGGVFTESVMYDAFGLAGDKPVAGTWSDDSL